jgi:hypothetical protein
MSVLSPSIFSCSHCAAFRLRQIEATAIQHTFICLTLFSQTDNSEANDWFLWLFVGRWTLVTLDWSVLFPEKSGFLQEQAQGLILENLLGRSTKLQLLIQLPHLQLPLQYSNSTLGHRQTFAVVNQSSAIMGRLQQNYEEFVICQSSLECSTFSC